jgi:drug/metabolite transporter (DMT)-like permease
VKYKAWLFLLLCNLFWSGNMIVGKLVTDSFPPIWMVGIRWFIAFLFLFPLACFIEKPNWLKVIKENYGVLLFMSITGTFVYNWLTYVALQHTTSLNASLICALNPAMIMIFSFFILKTRIKKIQVLGLIISFIGVLLVITKGHPFLAFQLNYNIGDGFMMMCVIMWGLYSVIGKKANSIPPITTIAITAFFGGAATVPFLITAPLDFSNLTSASILGIIFIGVFPSFLSFLLWNIGNRMLTPAVAGLSINSLCIFTAVISFIIGEKILISQIIGGVIIVTGIVLSSGLKLGYINKNNKTVKNYSGQG